MGWAERELHPERSARDLYGAEIRRLRKLHDMSLGRLAVILNVSKGHLSRIEGGDSKVPEGLSEALDLVFNTDGSFLRLYPLASKEDFPDKYKRFMELAEQAICHEAYETTIPGLLQTEEVARAVLQAGEPFAAEGEIDDWLTKRLRRQKRPNRQPSPCRYWFIVDEGAIRRPIGGLEIMAEQLNRLPQVCRLPHVTIQVLPFSAGQHSEMGGSLTLLTLPDRSVVAYEEGSRSGTLFTETEEVAHRQALYDLLRAQALSPRASEATISAALEGLTDAILRQARPVAEEQL
ncbi:helix-turn-helix domain-containing protein [Kitasatospora sp. NPDC056651]|uniref:helix-turn-helix domain-containing protein n=1 Tax=Kitasatospora sp. NPDC056651 TaxID=3345892 RepID=UPI0036B64892